MAKRQHANVIGQLQELGLNEHEAAIYLAVLRLGEASAGAILDEVKLHREQVYRALKRLTDSGLLTHYEKRKRGYYSAANPDILVKRIQAKAEIAESLQPYLRDLHRQKPQVIQVIEGIEAYQFMFEDMLSTLKKDDEYLVISGFGTTFYELTKDFYPRYTKQMAKKEIMCRLVTYENEDFSEQFSRQRLLQVRAIPGSYAPPVATAIYGNKVAIEVLDPDNLAIIFIENEKVANAYRHTFSTLWAIGKDLQA